MSPRSSPSAARPEEPAAVLPGPVGAAPRPVAGGGASHAPAPPVLVLAAGPADAAVLVNALSEAGMTVAAAASPLEIALRRDETGCLVLTQEALAGGVVAEIGHMLAEQPAWSELPILVLADRVADVFALRASLDVAWDNAQVSCLTRPVAPLVLVTAVHNALSSRMRQFLLRDQFTREAELRRELNHRVKNILVTVQAMAKMTERSAATDGERFDAFRSRLASLAAVHAMLFDAPDGAATFAAVARVVLAPFGVADDRDGSVRVAITGPERPLHADAAKALAMVVQELVTNALKYGALSNEEGRVELSLTETDGRATFSWTESGGPRVEPPSREGYGTRYLGTALAGLFAASAELSYEPDGFGLRVAGPSDAILSR